MEASAALSMHAESLLNDCMPMHCRSRPETAPSGCLFALQSLSSQASLNLLPGRSCRKLPRFDRSSIAWQPMTPCIWMPDSVQTTPSVKNSHFAAETHPRLGGQNSGGRPEPVTSRENRGATVKKEHIQEHGALVAVYEPQHPCTSQATEHGPST
jgi:hypothetical protein